MGQPGETPKILEMAFVMLTIIIPNVIMMEEIVVDHVRTKKNAVWVTVVIVGMEDQAIAKVHKLCINISVVYICASLLHLAVESQ